MAESIAALIAACVCLICDYFTADKLSWSIIAIESIIAAWLVTIPVLTAKSKIILKTLFMVSVIPIPFLVVLAFLLGELIVFTLGACISLISIVAVWIIYRIFSVYRKQLWKAFGFSLLVMIPVPIAITFITACFIPEAQFDFTSCIFNSGITLALSLICFGLDYSFRKRKEALHKE